MEATEASHAGEEKIEFHRRQKLSDHDILYDGKFALSVKNGLLQDKSLPVGKPVGNRLKSAQRTLS